MSNRTEVILQVSCYISCNRPGTVGNRMPKPHMRRHTASRAVPQL